MVKSPEEKYANKTEYQDFKRRLWDIKHPDEDAPATWFSADTRGTIAPDDDDIIVGHQVQSLKCPLTLQLLEKPMRNTTCPHVYSLDAIKELVRNGRGICPCPVSGCNSEVTMAGIREDKVMARKVRQEKERAEERMEAEGRDVQDITEGMSEIIYEDDDLKIER